MQRIKSPKINPAKILCYKKFSTTWHMTFYSRFIFIAALAKVNHCKAKKKEKRAKTCTSMQERTLA